MEAFGQLSASSQAMRVLFESAARLAESDMTLLLLGETGTGKSSLARAMHERSARKNKPFVVFDCAAVAANLIDSALFGHERGAFTGADRARVGALEAAEDGTLFIDELSELPLDLQPKLLRALEERVLLRLGNNTEMPVRCRVIAAAQDSLVPQVQSRRFRRDLYFRIAAASLVIPPLRDRKEDIPALVSQMLERAGDAPDGFARLGAAVKRKLLDHPWPGNVRELRNAVERLRMQDEAEFELLTIRQAQAPQAAQEFDFELSYLDFKERYVSEIERAYVTALLGRAKGNVSRAAQLGRMNRRYLYRLLDKYGLRDATLVQR